jgi:uncharacterized protein YdeI (YjbR/CyaY-like superfamily)
MLRVISSKVMTTQTWKEAILDLDLDEDVDNNNSMPDLKDASSIASNDVASDAFDDLGVHKQAEMLWETKEAKTAISRVSRPL